MMTPRFIHCDLIGTPKKNGPMIFNFLKAAAQAGHFVRTASSLSGNRVDTSVKNAYGAGEAPFLLPTMDKGKCNEIARTTGRKTIYDILIDNDPDEPSGFEACAVHHIAPDSPTLLEDLQTLAREELGFEFDPETVYPSPTGQRDINSIFIVDDSSDGCAMLTRSFLDFFPDAKITELNSTEDLQKAIQSDGVPDVMVTDCTDGAYDKWGAQNARALIDAALEKDIDHQLPIIFFTSADIDRAISDLQTVKRIFSAEDTLHLYTLDKKEISIARDMRDGKPFNCNRALSTTEGFRRFLRHQGGLYLPIAEEEVYARALECEEINPRSLVSLVEDGRYGRDVALAKLHDEALRMNARRYHVTAKTYGDDLDDGDVSALSCSFREAAGCSVTGYAAFTPDDIEALKAQGKKPILFSRKGLSKVLPHLGDIEGLVWVSPVGAAHARDLLEGHGVSGAFGVARLNRNYTFLRTPEGRQILVGKKIIEQEGASAFHEYERLLRHMAYEHITAHVPRMQNDDYEPTSEDYEGIPPLTVDINTLQPDETLSWGERVILPVTKIRAGDPVTIATEQGEAAAAQVYPMHLPLIEERLSDLYDWLDSVDGWLSEWHKDHGINRLAFKANLDGSSQVVRAYNHADGIGLVRTEHFMMTGEGQLDAYKSAVLDCDPDAFTQLQHACADDMKKVLYPGKPDFPIRIRLADVLPDEAFSPEEMTRYNDQYGAGTRGVQLAEQLPALYEAQAYGIFLAVRQGAQEYREEQAQPEIMVPTVRTVEELMFVKSMVGNAAREFDMSHGDYRFGSMVETLAACDNIEVIAAECDFLSIGSNDLTSEILGCPRDDYGARHDMMREHRRNQDPFVTLYPEVIEAISDMVRRARRVNSDIQIDCCGGQVQDIASLEALRPLKLNGVSMPPNGKNMHTLKFQYHYGTFDKHPANGNVPALRAARKSSAPGA